MSKDLGKKLGRTTSHRKALYRNLLCSLVKHEQIKTTEAKAKALRSFAERIITKAKKNDLHNKRMVKREVSDRDVMNKIFEVLVPRYEKKTSGYTKLIKICNRFSDNASMCIIKFI